MPVLIDLQTHDNAIAKHNAIQTCKFLCRLSGVVINFVFPAFEIYLPFDMLEKCVFVILILVATRVVGVA
ncbi:hypothetical protein MT325_m532R [Paramecium bursaria chlorella virus MT325]|uniref:Uncharacterized protein m532R n=1 Tax=Paramecium bursaria Chlorella virus MT325 TaxID=346932 RepID=A7IUR2_PBCVM|nr:hypothetical protein MT325_m532R [Paramecium bursaria chlorella virus MT325]